MLLATDQYVDESSHAFDVLVETIDAFFVGALFLEHTQSNLIRNLGQPVDIDTLSHELDDLIGRQSVGLEKKDELQDREQTNAG